MFNRRCTRTAENSLGRGQFEKETEGNALAALRFQVASAAMKLGTWWTVGNPRSLLLWALPCLAPLVRRPGVDTAFLVYCRFNSPYRKQTHFVGTLPGLSSVSCKCSRDRFHI